MAADLELHDRLIRQAVETSGGTVFKHTGDGMIAMFDDPVAAVDAAAAIQRAISAAQWQQPDQVEVRAAVHSGVVYPRDGDLFGTAVNKVARILGTCPPRAVLVSSATTALLAERAPEGLELRPVGSVLLAGFSAPDALYALVGPGLSAIDTIADRTHDQQLRLPSIDDELVGRSDELATVWDALERSRLVTLAGVGGMGKTRLALEVAAGAAESFTDGAWWIDLSNATSSDAALSVAMAAVGAREAPGRTPLQAFCDHFVGRSALVVVDNCEHVLGAAADMVAALRSAAADVRLVCTSREALGVRGEHIVPIGSLPVSDGVELFIERARAVQPDLRVDDDRDVIERLCVRLDGIPLAIELAAARCRAMIPAEVDARLDDRFRLLRGGRSGAERHRTLQATMAWSYSLLDSGERAVFDKMAVFAGGTCIDGLAAVCDLDELDALDIVDRLVARSMVVATRTPLGTRYHQLETLRQYAEDRLIEAGTLGLLRDRHLHWVLHLAESIESANATPRAGDAFRRFCNEVDNIRLAVDHAVATGRFDDACRIVAAMQQQALARPAFELCDRVRALPNGGRWTIDNATCAALGAYGDQARGIRPPDGIIGGIPEHFLTEVPEITCLQASVWLMTGVPWRTPLELIERAWGLDPSTVAPTMTAWVLCFYFGQLAGDVSDDEFDMLYRRGHEALDHIRQNGDELMMAALAYRLAYAIVERRPAEAVDLAAAAVATAERLGASSIRQNSLAIYHLALTLAAGGRGVEQAVAVRTAMVAALTDQQYYSAGVLTNAAFAHIAATEPNVAIVMALVWRRVAVGDVERRLLRSGITPPADISPYEQRAAVTSLRDALGDVVKALDRVIAAGGDG